MFTLAAPAIPGCAHYYLPPTVMDSPEAIGRDSIGHVDLLGIQGGPDLSSEPVLVAPPSGSTEAPKPTLQKSMANFAMGYTYPLSDATEIGARLEPSAPLLFHIKRQLTGPRESEAKTWDFSAALVGSAGLLLGDGVTYTLFGGAVIGGVRVGKRHLVSLSPFFRTASLGSDSASVTGAALGYQYDLENLLLRMELDSASGSKGSNAISGIFVAASVSIRLGPASSY